MVGRERRQRSEQYLTSSHTFSHFLRQQNGKPQITQTLLGRLDCLRIFIGGQFSSLVKRFDLIWSEKCVLPWSWYTGCRVVHVAM